MALGLVRTSSLRKTGSLLDYAFGQVARNLLVGEARREVATHLVRNWQTCTVDVLANNALQIGCFFWRQKGFEYFLGGSIAFLSFLAVLGLHPQSINFLERLVFRLGRIMNQNSVKDTWFLATDWTVWTTTEAIGFLKNSEFYLVRVFLFGFFFQLLLALGKLFIVLPHSARTHTSHYRTAFQIHNFLSLALQTLQLHIFLRCDAWFEVAFIH